MVERRNDNDGDLKPDQSREESPLEEFKGEVGGTISRVSQSKNNDNNILKQLN